MNYITYTNVISFLSMIDNEGITIVDKFKQKKVLNLISLHVNQCPHAYFF